VCRLRRKDTRATIPRAATAFIRKASDTYPLVGLEHPRRGPDKARVNISTSYFSIVSVWSMWWSRTPVEW
jgi:hypothetical protein